MLVWGRGLIFDDWGVEIASESDAWRCLNHSKYLCFAKIPLSRLIEDWGILREGLGPHVGRFWSIRVRFL